MKCQNCGGDIQRVVLYRTFRLCSMQCQEAVVARTKVFEAPPKMDLRQSLQREYLADDECNCMKCRPRGDP
jgi:hypothetical protein